MQRRTEIIKESDLVKRYGFRLEEVIFRHERYDGNMSGEIVRLNFDRGDSVAAVVHDPRFDSVVLIEQFRYSAYKNGHGWIIELPAGMILPKDGGDPKRALIRELREEIGYKAENLIRIMTFYPSVGGSSERVFLYYVAVSEKDRIGDGGGREDEGEDIRCLFLQVDEAIRKVDEGLILDAKTIIGLQWLRQNRHAV
ncbi:MAG: NUDIX hydrolase [Deltaproteobacteria bacterium]|jgi:ADP-ribose pyrophosphatase|nr:NUDIX hydrolase [Deltaproteobacteria bacterium]